MKLPAILLTVLLSVASAYATVLYVEKHGGIASMTAPSVKETAFERVMRTGVLRCGYYVFPPVTQRDLNTNELSGFAVDLTNRLAANAGLKVEWTEEVDFGNWTAELQAGRFDAMCTPAWPTASMSRVVRFTRPFIYSSINVYARGDDHRFDNNLKAVNDPSVTIAVIEGTALVELIESHFPKAKLLLLPQNSPGGSQAENLATKKADLILWDENGVFDYLKTHPGGVHNIAPGHPVRIMPFELAVQVSEDRLRDFLDTALQDLEDTGYLEQVIRKWERAPGSFFYLAPPYALPDKQ